jgi:hypothetical protein
MQILRLAPYPLSVTYDVPTASTEYVLVIKENSRDVVIVEDQITSNTSAKIVFTLPDYFNSYDDSYRLAIYEDDSVDEDEIIYGDIVVEDNLEIMRPYVDPSSLGTTGSEIAEYTALEGMARAIIDSIVPKGFYYEVSWYEPVGNNNDFMSLWDRTYKILKVYENNQLVWDTSDPNGPALGDWNYFITKDKTAIIKEWVQQNGSHIRLTGNPVGVPLGFSDGLSLYDSSDDGSTLAIIPGVTFPMGWNYLFQLETGYKVIPYDIKDATMMLIEDLKCGKLDYHNRSVTRYSTDQYRIEIDKSALEGTGNLLVDKILNKYITNIGKPGVL